MQALHNFTSAYGQCQNTKASFASPPTITDLARQAVVSERIPVVRREGRSCPKASTIPGHGPHPLIRRSSWLSLFDVLHRFNCVLPTTLRSYGSAKLSTVYIVSAQSSEENPSAEERWQDWREVRKPEDEMEGKEQIQVPALPGIPLQSLMSRLQPDEKNRIIKRRNPSSRSKSAQVQGEKQRQAPSKIRKTAAFVASTPTPTAAPVEKSRYPTKHVPSTPRYHCHAMPCHAAAAHAGPAPNFAGLSPNYGWPLHQQMETLRMGGTSACSKLAIKTARLRKTSGTRPRHLV